MISKHSSTSHAATQHCFISGRCCAAMLRMAGSYNKVTCFLVTLVALTVPYGTAMQATHDCLFLCFNTAKKKIFFFAHKSKKKSFNNEKQKVIQNKNFILNNTLLNWKTANNNFVKCFDNEVFKHNLGAKFIEWIWELVLRINRIWLP